MLKPSSFLSRLFVEPTTNWFIQLIRYGFVGGVAFLVDYGSLFLLEHYLHTPYLLAAAVAFLLGLITNYLLSISWVFSKNRHQSAWVEFLVFAVIGLIGLGLNELIMWLCVDKIFHADALPDNEKSRFVMISKLISTAIVFFWNFFARKLSLFGKVKQEE